MSTVQFILSDVFNSDNDVAGNIDDSLKSFDKIVLLSASKTRAKQTLLLPVDSCEKYYS